MTASAEPVNQLILPEPFPGQQALLESTARFKVMRKGRRYGGSRGALLAAIAGHGAEGKQFPGMVQGAYVIWLGPDFKQTAAIWREEIKPRFRAVQGVHIVESEFRVELQGAGALEVLSNENVDVIRGRKPHGIVLDESAHFDLEYAWVRVVRPALATHEGWAIFASTTNADLDGNPAHRTPSYFNMLCSALTNSPLPEGIDYPPTDAQWAEFHYRTEDNPKLSRTEVESLYQALGGRESPAAQQELGALLILGGQGSAFPEYDPLIHEVADNDHLPKNWLYYGSLDWGHRQGCYHLYGVSSEGDVQAVWEFYDRFKQMHARSAARSILEASQYLPTPEIIYYDDQMEQDSGVDEDMTLLSEFQAGLDEFYGPGGDRPVLIAASKGPGSRAVKFNMVHKFLSHGDAKDEFGRLQPWSRPKLRIQKRCRALRRQLTSLPTDPRDREDVDTAAEDHAYDCVGNLLLSRFATPEVPEAPWDENKHPGLGPHGRRRRKALTLAEEAQETFARVDEMMVRKAPRWGTKYVDITDDDGYEGGYE